MVIFIFHCYLFNIQYIRYHSKKSKTQRKYRFVLIHNKNDTLNLKIKKIRLKRIKLHNRVLSAKSKQRKGISEYNKYIDNRK
jgi:hypothetical protein